MRTPSEGGLRTVAVSSLEKEDGMIKLLRIAGLALVGLGVAAGAGVAFAALSNTENASGTVNVTSTSADLYICETGQVAGPACGSDDSDGAENIFESIEDLRPGETVTYDIRLKNVGTEPFLVSDASLSISEGADPGNDCPASPSPLYGSGPNDNYYNTWGVSILGKAGDADNDNTGEYPNGIPEFQLETRSYTQLPIHIAAGDYEDVRLRLTMAVEGVGACDSNTWNVSWSFTAQ
jgi:hypothetical protein